MAFTQGVRLCRSILAAAAILALPFVATLTFAVPLNPAMAGKADVLDATLEALGNGQYRVTATIRHDDEGWEHYVNRFDVVAPDGQVIQQRVLFHPHVDEQPFTRSLEVLLIPEGVDRIIIRAHDSRHGLGGWQAVLEVPPQPDELPLGEEPATDQAPDQAANPNAPPTAEPANQPTAQ
ncbi:MAG: hypothetical protein AAF213_03600 [Pseudomonadota bacterium]